MAAFQRLAHDVRIAGAIETVIRASISRINHRRDHLVEANVLRIDELRHAKLFGHGALDGIDVDANNPVCASQPGTLNAVEADAAQAEDNDIRPRLHPRGPDHRAYAGRPAATDIADLITSEQHPSDLQSLMRISYAVFCL